MKCDIVIPIYNHIEWVNLCIKAIFSNTDMSIVNKIYLIDDCSNKETKDGLNKIVKKYGTYVELISNEKNKGFVKNCNYAFSIFESDYILLLNSDCLLSNNALSKMINAMSKDSKIGLLCPISSKAANISFPLIDGSDYQKINEIFEKEFLGKTFDACTVVGNCLMISRECVKKVGGFDEIFEKGYTEETDYQFKAIAKGFKAKVLIDTYVFHECRVSFGEKQEQLEIRKKHLDIFFTRWGKDYYDLLEKYNKNNPIDYINNHIQFIDNNNYLNYYISKKCTEEEIELLNSLIIDNYRINIYTTKNNNKWREYNTLFIPKIKKYFKR